MRQIIRSPRAEGAPAARSAAYRAAARGDLPTIRMCGKLFVPTELVLQKIGLRPPVDGEPRAAS